MTSTFLCWAAEEERVDSRVSTCWVREESWESFWDDDCWRVRKDLFNWFSSRAVRCQS